MVAGTNGAAAELLNSYATKSGFRILTWTYTDFRYISNSKRPITKMADMAGLKFRVPQSAVLIDVYKRQPEELARVVMRAARILGVPITEKGAVEIGRRSRGTPSIANRLLRRVRDFAAVYGSGVVDEEQAAHALHRMDVDENGLDQMDRKLLRVLVDIYGGGPVGVKTLAVACPEEVRTIEDI